MPAALFWVLPGFVWVPQAGLEEKEGPRRVIFFVNAPPLQTWRGKPLVATSGCGRRDEFGTGRTMHPASNRRRAFVSRGFAPVTLYSQRKNDDISSPRSDSQNRRMDLLSHADLIPLGWTGSPPGPSKERRMPLL